MTLNITNARIPGYSGLQCVEVAQDGTIISICSTLTSSNPIIDLKGDWLSLGGIDLQINGCLGLAFPDIGLGDMDKLQDICQYLWTQGIDGFLPTIVTTSKEQIRSALATFTHYVNKYHQPNSAKILGVHLEGPFLNPQKKGAHPPQHLLPLNLEGIKDILRDFSNIVKIITLAPELDNVGDTIPYLRSLGIVVSLGHSTATAAQARQAFLQGATMVTHAFNAMPSLHHREPGLLGEALTYPGVYCGAIADGQHVCPTMLKILLRSSGYDQGVFLVSDALAPIGLPSGVYPWDDRQIEVKDHTAKLVDGTLAGTTLPLLAGVDNLVKWDICSLEQGIALATEAPRKAIGISGMEVGVKASFLRWDDSGRFDRINLHIP